MSDEEHLAWRETSRLALSVPPLSHADRVMDYDARNREHLAPWAPPRPHPMDTVEAWRERLVMDRARAREGSAFHWRMRAREAPEGLVIGTVSLTRIERGPLERASLGIGLDVGHEGLGLAQEAIAAVVDFAANELALRFLEAGHAPQNLRSASMLRRAGFVPFGYARDYLHVGGRVQDHVLLQCDLRPHRRP